MVVLSLEQATGSDMRMTTAMGYMQLTMHGERSLAMATGSPKNPLTLSVTPRAAYLLVGMAGEIVEDVDADEVEIVLVWAAARGRRRRRERTVRCIVLKTRGWTKLKQRVLNVMW